MPKIVDIPEEDLVTLLQEGTRQKDIATMYDCSIPTVRAKIKELFQEEGIWSKYRDIRDIHLTKLQYKILTSISEEDIELASLAEKVNAYRVLQDKELVASGKPTEIKGLLGYLVKAEEKEKRIQENERYQEAEYSDNTEKADGQTLTTSKNPLNPAYRPALW